MASERNVKPNLLCSTVPYDERKYPVSISHHVEPSNVQRVYSNNKWILGSGKEGYFRKHFLGYKCPRNISIDRHIFTVTNINTSVNYEYRVIFRLCNVYISVLDKATGKICFFYGFSIYSLANLKKTTATYYTKLGVFVLDIIMSDYPLDTDEYDERDDLHILINAVPYALNITYNNSSIIQNNHRGLLQFNNLKIVLDPSIDKNFVRIRRSPAAESDNYLALFIFLSTLLRYNRDTRFTYLARSAVKANDVNILDYQCKYDNTTLLHYAACYSTYREIKFILKYKTNANLLNIKDHNNRRPIDIAIDFKRDKEIIDSLKPRCPDFSSSSSSYNSSSSCNYNNQITSISNGINKLNINSK